MSHSLFSLSKPAGGVDVLRPRGDSYSGSSRPFSEVVREQVQQEHRENVVERVLKDQVSLVTQKLDSFQENLAAKFLLLEGRVRFLEAALSRVGGKSTTDHSSWGGWEEGATSAPPPGFDLN